MRTITIVACILFASSAIALPVTQKEKHEDKSTEKPSDPAEIEAVLEYERYLKEVVEALESDSEFRKKLDKAPEADIRTGKIAQELEYVSHNVRSKLDEIKRREIERLRQLANKQFELSNDIDRDHIKIPEHLDHDNYHTFEIEDLKKLILKTSQDLAEADKKRREEFKQYEMQKEFEKQATLKELDEDKRKKYEEELKLQKEKHNKHPKVHHPGNKAQLEEVWEKQDHMDGVDFDPRTFFMIHDVDGNGYWDETELKALFVKELDKVYQSGAPEDDLRERAEEMERMREHVFKESDTNHDGLISFQEFIDQTKRDEFNRDPTWETVDNEPQFTHEEYMEFERRRQEEIQRLIASGQLPPHPNMPQGYYPGPGAEYQVHPNQVGNYPSHPQAHYQQQQYQQQQHQQQYQQQQHQQYQQQQQLNQQYQQQQMPQHNQQYQQQVPQQNQHPNQPPPPNPNVQQGYQPQQPNAIPNQVQYQQPPPQQPNVQKQGQYAPQPPSQQQPQQQQVNPQQVQLNSNQVYQAVPNNNAPQQNVNSANQAQPTQQQQQPQGNPNVPNVAPQGQASNSVH